jgi:glycosyltransferase involved in cell wall biosynthesis
MLELIALKDQKSFYENDLPVVSVFNWTYNQKDYIRDSIDSILSQRTNFRVEIVIHDDASNDGTREIILEYQTEYPNLFNNILQDENQWSNGNGVMRHLFEKPRGKYIALAHGDDCWIDPLKLYKQVMYLEANLDCSLSFHASRNLFKNKPDLFSIQRPRIITSDLKYSMKHAILFDGGMMSTNSMVFLNDHIKDIPKWVIEAPIGDWPLMLVLASKGKLGYMDDVMCNYQVMSKGSWSETIQDNTLAIEHYRAVLKMLNNFNLWSKYKFNFFVTLKKIYYKIIMLIKFKIVK